MTTILQYFLRNSNDVQLLIDFAELLLVLLRDDCVFVRNATSDIVVLLTHTNRPDLDGFQKGAQRQSPDFDILKLFI